MTVPTGVNYYEFYKAAKLKGVKVTSKFVGVSINVFENSNSIHWIARVQSKGELLYWAKYPFTERGEVLASKAYERFLRKNNIPKRFLNKRKYTRN